MSGRKARSSAGGAGRCCRCWSWFPGVPGLVVAAVAVAAASEFAITVVGIAVVAVAVAVAVAVLVVPLLRLLPKLLLCHALWGCRCRVVVVVMTALSFECVHIRSSQLEFSRFSS